MPPEPGFTTPITRRAIVQGSAWAVPSVAFASLTPAMAASPEKPTCDDNNRFGFRWEQVPQDVSAHGRTLISSLESGNPIGEPVSMTVTSQMIGKTLPVERYNMKVGRRAGSDDPSWDTELGGRDWEIKAWPKRCLVLNQYCKVDYDDSYPKNDHIGGYTYLKDIDKWGTPLQKITLTFSEPVSDLLIPVVDLTSADQYGSAGGLLWWMRYTDIVYFETDTQELPSKWYGDIGGIFVTRKEYPGRYANAGIPGTRDNPFYRVGAASDYGDYQSHGGGVTGNEWRPEPQETDNRNLFFSWEGRKPVSRVDIFYAGQFPIKGNTRDYFYTNAQYIGLGDITFRRRCA